MSGKTKKKRKKEEMLNPAVLARYFSGICIFVTGVLLVRQNVILPAFIVFLSLMVLQIVSLYAESRNLLDLRILLSLSWLGGIALSVLGLTEWQRPWSLTMWLCAGGFYFLFNAAYDTVRLLYRRRKDDNVVVLDTGKQAYEKRMFLSIVILTAVVLAAFLAEGVLEDFAFPLLVKETPEAYTSFHVPGLHYFAVSSVLVHPLSVICLFGTEQTKKKKVAVLFMNLAAMAVPVLLLSKFLVFSAIMYSVLAFLIVKKPPVKKTLLILGAAVLCAAAVFILVVGMRHYPEGYLQKTFRFRNQATPVFIQYPYLYVTINYENLNVQIGNLQHYSYGLRGALPFFALTGLKKFVPQIAELFNSLERYNVFWQLPTETILYDAYSDFSVYGVAVFSLVLGAASAWISRMTEKRGRVFGILMYVQFANCLLLSFFSTWFSNATIWFYFIATFAIALFCTGEEKGLFRLRPRDLTEEMKC